jgi:hypothetical protein
MRHRRSLIGRFLDTQGVTHGKACKFKQGVDK